MSSAHRLLLVERMFYFFDSLLLRSQPGLPGPRCAAYGWHMSHEPAENQPDTDSSPSKHSTPVEEFISLLVPKPDLLPEEETQNDPDSEVQ